MSADVGQQVPGCCDVRGRRWPASIDRGSTTRTTSSSGSAARISSTRRRFFVAGYGKYFLNPTAESFLNGFSQSTPIDLVRPTADGRRPTRWRIPGRTASSSRLAARSGRSRSSVGARVSPIPISTVPNVHQFSVGVQRELPWQVALEASYVGSRSNDMQSQWNRFNEPSLDFVRQCDVTQGGSRSFCDALLPNPFFGVAAFEGATRFTNPTLIAVRVESAVSGVHRHQHDGTQRQPAVVRLGAVGRQQAMGARPHAQRDLHVGPAVDRGRAA